MKRTTVVTVAAAFALSLLPTAAHAAWWNPSSWWKHKATTTLALSDISTTTVSSVSAEPTIADLYKRIAELEDKLDKARKALAEAGKVIDEQEAEKKIEEKTEKKAPVETISLNEGIAHAKAAIVSVETATSTGPGVIINSQGTVLVAAHSVWATKEGVGVVGMPDMVTVRVGGTEKQGKLVGFDEASDAAVYEITPKGSYSYVKIASASTPTVDVPVAVFAADRSAVQGVVSKKVSSGSEATFSKEPSREGGIAINADGAVVGLSGKSSCKILQEMSTCLQYASTIRGVNATKIIAGMRLYKDKKEHSKIEELVRGKFDGMYRATNESTLVGYAISSVTGKSSFDNFNAKLGQDQDGKVTKLYLQKLKSSAEIIGTALDFLKNQADSLNIFFINEESSILTLGNYQRSTIAKIQSLNKAKLAEYQKQVALWSKKKNEYDAYLADPSQSTHDYLLEEGVVVEEMADYLAKEKQWTLDLYSGENAAIF